MIILDTDHLSILQHPENPQQERLLAAMERSADADFATTSISLEEQMRGWLAAISRARDVHKQLRYYERLTGLVEFYSRWQVIAFDEAAADLFVGFRRELARWTSKLQPSRVFGARFCSVRTCGTWSKCPDCVSRTGSVKWSTADNELE
jgi:tRNA(fMet)-specific endonuclease VapC